MRWRLRLPEYKYNVKYKKARNNVVADIVSRISSEGNTKVPTEDELLYSLTESVSIIDSNRIFNSKELFLEMKENLKCKKLLLKPVSKFFFGSRLLTSSFSR